jgi:ferrous iron transport protein A
VSQRQISLALTAPVAEADAAARVATLPGAAFSPLLTPDAPAPHAIAPADERPRPVAAPFSSLAALAPGTRAIVRHIHAETGFAHRLMELGLIPGTEVALVRCAPLGDPIELVVRGSHFSIRRSEAERIHVDAL